MNWWVTNQPPPGPPTSVSSRQNRNPARLRGRNAILEWGLFEEFIKNFDFEIQPIQFFPEVKIHLIQVKHQNFISEDARGPRLLF